MGNTIFLDTNILKPMFIATANGKDWRKEIGLPLDSFRLVTSQKCVIEMYGILKTTALTSDLAVYGCGYASSGKSPDSILKNIFGGDEFLNIYWHRQVLETWVTVKEVHAEKEDEHTKRLRLLAQWRACYERVRSDFDAFLEANGIEIILYSVLFAQHEWQARLEDLAIETLIPKEDLEIVLSALFVGADIFLTEEKELVRKAFSLPPEPNVPSFCLPKDLERTLSERSAGFKSFPSS